MVTLITPEQLRSVCPSVNKIRSEELAELFNELGNKYGIKDKDIFHEFFANVAQESGEFAHKTENMSYSAKRLVQVWPNRFPNLQAAQPFAHNPVALANKSYGGRMGNTQPNDGWDFRGGGYAGLTGREVYTEYAKYAGYDSPQAASADVRRSERAAIDSAYWFFCIKKNLEAKAEADDFIGIVKSWNGGLIGLNDRKRYYERVKKHIL